MTARDFAIQSTIKDLRYDCRGQTGIVIGNDLPDGEMTLAVEWTNGRLEKVSVDDVELINNEMEQDFLTVKAKIEQACALVEEAEAMAVKHGCSARSILDGDINLDVLRFLCDDSGWDSSQKCW